MKDAKEAAKNAAPLAGWSMNPNAPVEQRLAASQQALDFYVDRIDKMDQLVDQLRADVENNRVSVVVGAVYLDVALRLEQILDGTVPMDENPINAPG